MKKFICLGVLLLSLPQAQASGTRELSLNFGDEMKKKEMTKPVSLKTFKCEGNERLISCTRRFKKLKAMMERN